MTKETFETKVFSCILNEKFVAQAAADLDTVVWARDSVARSQFWEIGENEDSLFGHITYEHSSLGYWPKEIEKTLIGYSNALFGEEIQEVLTREITKILHSKESSVLNFISHLIFMSCRCTAAISARKDEILKEDFRKYFNLVAKKLKAYYQLGDFDEHSFPKCELIALKMMYKYFDEIFANAKKGLANAVALEDENEDEDHEVFWSLRASEVNWTFYKTVKYSPTAYSQTAIYIGNSVEVEAFDDVAFPDGMTVYGLSCSSLLDEYLENILSGNIPYSKNYVNTAFGIKHGDLAYDWDLRKARKPMDAFEPSPIPMPDDLIAAVFEILKGIVYGD